MSHSSNSSHRSASSSRDEEARDPAHVPSRHEPRSFKEQADNRISRSQIQQFALMHTIVPHSDTRHFVVSEEPPCMISRLNNREHHRSRVSSMRGSYPMSYEVCDGQDYLVRLS